MSSCTMSPMRPAPKRSTAWSSVTRSTPGATAARSPDTWKGIGALASRPTALFQVSLTSANPDAEHTATAQMLIHDLIERTGCDPDLVGLFAGALVYTRYGWMKRRIMRSIARKEGGDTDLTRDYEYTDWAAVDQFAHDKGTIVRSTGPWWEPRRRRLGSGHVLRYC